MSYIPAKAFASRAMRPETKGRTAARPASLNVVTSSRQQMGSYTTVRPVVRHGQTHTYETGGPEQIAVLKANVARTLIPVL